MLRRTAILAVLITAFLIGMSLAATQTFTGTITDTMCGKKHMIAGKSDADCTRECMKSKGDWTYGIVVGEKVYGLIGDGKQFESLAGKHVIVKGDLSGKSITVKSVSDAH